jgi:hypothetical protein
VTPIAAGPPGAAIVRELPAANVEVVGLDLADLTPAIRAIRTSRLEPFSLHGGSAASHRRP